VLDALARTMNLAAFLGLVVLAPSSARAASPPSERGQPEVAAVPWNLAEPVDDEPIAPTNPRVSKTALAPVEPPPQPPPVATGSPLRPRRELERMSEKPIGPGKVKYKPGRGLLFESDNGKYALAMNLAAQFLYTLQDTTPVPMGQTKRTTNTFEIRRARLFLNGHVFSKHVKYWVQLQFSPRDLGISNGKIGQSPIFQWQVTFDWLRDFTPQVGLNFIPYARQRVAPIMKLQFVDNSIASYEFTLDRDIGVNIISKDLGGLGKLRYYAGVYMGEGPDFAKPVDFGLVYNARFEILPFGDFDDYAEGDHARLLEPKLSIGGAYAFADNDSRNRALGSAPSDGGSTDTHNATVDVVFKMAGFALLADAYYRFGRRKYGSAMGPPNDDGVSSYLPIELPRNGVGWTAQAGYLIPRVPFEIAGRYSGIHRLGSLTSLRNSHEAGPALSYYFAEHSIKLQLDYLHLWNEDSVRSDRVRLQLTLGF
jgi:phosphate-selective porin OprO and OprP